MVLQTNSPKEATKMNTKIRTAIITLIAAGGFATATVAPAVSQAQWHTICNAGHCTTHQNAKLNGKAPCEAIKAASGGAYDGLLGAIGPRPVLVNGPSGTQVEAERTHQIEEEEARVAAAERAAFEYGCSPA
jgi:hypothetical protein